MIMVSKGGAANMIEPDALIDEHVLWWWNVESPCFETNSCLITQPIVSTAPLLLDGRQRRVVLLPDQPKGIPLCVAL
jgi:hypothetical protein